MHIHLVALTLRKLLKERIYELTEINEQSFNEIATWVIKTRLASSSNFHRVAF